MHHLFRVASVFAVALSFAAAAHADEFSFSYTFGGTAFSAGAGTMVTGTFYGTASGNVITDISDPTVIIEGSALPGTIFVQSWTGSSWIDGDAQISLNGEQNNFSFINSDTAADDDDSTGYFLSITVPAVTNGQGGDIGTNINPTAPTAVFAIDASFSPAEGDGVNSSWTVTDLNTQAAAPDGGATVEMLGAALTGLALLRRRSARA